jgi:hypothetical protein
MYERAERKKKSKIFATKCVGYIAKHAGIITFVSGPAAKSEAVDDTAEEAHHLKPALSTM